jgi:putative ABC transport system ATP-binding protein
MLSPSTSRVFDADYAAGAHSIRHSNSTRLSLSIIRHRMQDHPQKHPAIEVLGLSKKVADASGELSILSDLNFTVQPGATVALVGASGSGKSTLLGLLAGLDTPSSGTVCIDGTDLYKQDEDGRAALRKARIGFVFQSFQLLGHLTSLENVMLPLELRGDKNAKQKALAMLDRVGLSQRLKHYPKFLSGGEQQRVALARAFVTEPPLLLADEPTGSLDAATGEAVIGLMFQLNREQHSTLVLVTHDSAIASMCQRQITISAGRIVADNSSTDAHTATTRSQ